MELMISTTTPSRRCFTHSALTDVNNFVAKVGSVKARRKEASGQPSKRNLGTI